MRECFKCHKKLGFFEYWLTDITKCNKNDCKIISCAKHQLKQCHNCNRFFCSKDLVAHSWVNYDGIDSECSDTEAWAENTRKPKAQINYYRNWAYLGISFLGVNEVMDSISFLEEQNYKFVMRSDNYIYMKRKRSKE